MTAEQPVEVSIVMPCLSEAATLEICVIKSLCALRDNRIPGEVVVADNGSTDGSPVIARRLGARVVPVAVSGTLMPELYHTGYQPVSEAERDRRDTD
jgi:glycosyltransferase involved in cell wall biosynthesis